MLKNLTQIIISNNNKIKISHTRKHGKNFYLKIKKIRTDYYKKRFENFMNLETIFNKNFNKDEI